MRYTKKFIRARFEMAMQAIGAPTGDTYVDGKAVVGVHSLDHNSMYGGYCIRKIANECGGESSPFGSERHPANAFVALLTGIIYAVDYKDTMK